MRMFSIEDAMIIFPTMENFSCQYLLLRKFSKRKLPDEEFFTRKLNVDVVLFIGNLYDEYIFHRKSSPSVCFLYETDEKVFYRRTCRWVSFYSKILLLKNWWWIWFSKAIIPEEDVFCWKTSRWDRFFKQPYEEFSIGNLPFEEMLYMKNSLWWKFPEEEIFIRIG